MDSPQQREPIILRPAGALFLVFLAFAAFMSALLIISSPARGRVAGALVFHVAVAVGLLMGMYVGLNRHAPNDTTLVALRLSRPARHVAPFLLLGALAGLALGPLGELLLDGILSVWPLPNLSAEQQAELARSMASPLTFAVVASLVANLAFVPFLEEAFFRGLLQPNLEKSVGARRAFAVTLALYLLPLIGFPRLIPTQLLVAAPLGLLALWSRNTWPSVCAHVAFQISPYLFRWLGVSLGSKDGGGLHAISWGWVLLLSVGAIATLAVARSGRLRAPQPVTEEETRT